MFLSHPLREDFTVEIVPTDYVVPPAIEERVAKLWAAERRTRGSVFDGEVMSLVRRAEGYLTLTRRPYRYVVARLRDPSLASILDVRAVGVAGVLTCADGVVLGRRGDDVTQEPGCWEPAPSGALSTDHPLEQLIAELHEELGISKQNIEAWRPLGIVEDTETGVSDIVFELRTSLPADAICASHATSGSHEYATIAVVPKDGLDEFRSVHRDELVSTFDPILHAAGLAS